MNAPLSHYYIYTGHNSYLTGNQLSSESSNLPIIEALQRGVRVIELDLWPTSTGADVEVRHGWTLTTPVELTKCLNSIKEHAFVASAYPVIITIEDHLTSDLQAKAAAMIKETLGDLLFCPTTEFLDEFPSPENLKFRILISTKPPKDVLESGNSKYKYVQLQNETKEGTHIPEIIDSDTPSTADYKPGAPEYKRLIAISSRKGKRELMNCVGGNVRKVTRLSLNELSFEKEVTSCGPELIRFTQRNILRIYPKGTRITSSNFNPLLGWMYGAQMVALNMQGYGRSLWLMHGFYKANGGCGYIKKPDFLLKTDPHTELFHPFASLPIKKTLKVNLHLGDGWRIHRKQNHLSGYSPPVFYAKVKMVGVPGDNITKKTKKVEGWTPIWNKEFAFELRVPELALLRIEVRKYNLHQKDGFGGQTCLPVSELRAGIRAVPLLDRKGNRYRSVKLLAQFSFV